jgi:hypothetical protein
VSRYREAKLQKMTVRAMETLPALLLGLSTGKPGDENEPIVLDGAGDSGGSSGGGAGPSGIGDRNLEPPTDSDDSDFEELTRDQFRANLAGPRINELVAPGLKVQKVTRGGQEMYGLFATRDFKKCEAVGVYDGEVLTVPEFESETSARRKIYAYETSVLHTEDSDLRLVILPTLLPDGSGIDFQAHPLASVNEPGPSMTSNTYMQQCQLPPDAMQGPNPGDFLEPLTCMVLFTTTKIAAGTELTLHYGNKFNRDYAVGRPTTVTCPRDLSELFPRGVPWSAIAKISEDMLDEPKDRGDDGEWRPSQRRRR